MQLGRLSRRELDSQCCQTNPILGARGCLGQSHGTARTASLSCGDAALMSRGTSLTPVFVNRHSQSEPRQAKDAPMQANADLTHSGRECAGHEKRGGYLARTRRVRRE
jgi:hypothetical protein